AAAASRVRIGLPSLTLSPILTLSSLTTPAAGAGTSMVALSDSSVTSESSAFTVSPGLTKTSMTGTSLKSPISGTLTSIVLIAAPKKTPPERRPACLARAFDRQRRTTPARSLRHGCGRRAATPARCHPGPARSQQRPPHVGEERGEKTIESRGRRAIDHAVVVGQRQRQNQPRDELLAIPYRSRGGAADAENGDFRSVDDRREISAADAAEAGDRKAAALHVGRAQLALARLGGEFAHFPGYRQHAFLVGVLDHRDDQAVGRIGGEADMVVA